MLFLIHVRYDSQHGVGALIHAVVQGPRLADLDSTPSTHSGYPVPGAGGEDAHRGLEGGFYGSGLEVVDNLPPTFPGPQAVS